MTVTNRLILHMNSGTQASQNKQAFLETATSRLNFMKVGTQIIMTRLLCYDHTDVIAFLGKIVTKFANYNKRFIIVCEFCSIEGLNCLYMLSMIFACRALRICINECIVSVNEG